MVTHYNLPPPGQGGCEEDGKFWEKSKWEPRTVDLRGERDETESPQTCPGRLLKTSNANIC